MEGSVTGMEAFLNTVGTVFTKVLDMSGELITFIMENPMLAFGFIIMVISFVVGLVLRLKNN